ncbi:hypothetical protein [Pseudobdellovibrio exovorus]|uniref:Uncharacterized protein n=1 Tax=Pseudobdellovibrio exovorus JSS TaxID=1184267 RepID=M4V893_9BACT|nr:hypothetical protein [Pseudobdellovibrio exovorus]AGH95607.1 hypothetical protein A11Q_1391 [Pseudobdellovibrio exovorus JSS]
MKQISFSADAFSHSQIKSKLWLSNSFSTWYRKYFLPQNSYTLHWYGSWVGLGPFILLINSDIQIDRIDLYDLTLSDLEVSKKILNFFDCEGVHVVPHHQDVNQVPPVGIENQIFINTSCEHMASQDWLIKIPKDSFIVLQATDMPHKEHINSPQSLDHFIEKYADHLNILETDQLPFEYPDKSFTRFMIFGTKK